jgi:hypothetical protein
VSPRTSRRRPPPRDILAARVRSEELPDIARPTGPAPRPGGARPAAAPLPWQLAAIACRAQAAAITDAFDRGLVPMPVVPGAVLMRAQLRAAARMLGDGD